MKTNIITTARISLERYPDYQYTLLYMQISFPLTQGKIYCTPKFRGNRNHDFSFSKIGSRYS